MKIKVDFKSLAMLLFFSVMSQFAFAQKTISGSVTDGANGDPLVGAAVVVTGTTKGTLTDVDGNYTLSNVGNDATSLTFSFTGYSSLTVPIGANSVVNAKLAGGTILEQVVVVGFGTLKSKEVTSSIVTIKAEEFNKGNVNNAAQLLQGKVAGLSISNPGGNPNSTPEIRLRGISTLGGNSQPLIVVDGIPNIPIGFIDPNDIESVDILKDGAAAAIYGAQGSSGVILITTKKAPAGKTSVTYNAQLISTSIARTPQVMTKDEYLAAAKAANVADADANKGSNTDWYDEISRTALTHTHSLSLAGGLGNGGYRASLNYRDIQGVTNVDGQKWLNGRLSVEQKGLNDRLKVGLSLVTSQQDQTLAFADAFRYATLYNPTAPVKKDGAAFAKYGGYYQEDRFDYANPVAILEQSKNTAIIKFLQMGGNASLEIVKGLTLNSTYSRIQQSRSQTSYIGIQSYFGKGLDRKGQLDKLSKEQKDDYFNTFLNFKKGFGSSELDFVAGYDYQTRTTEVSSILDLGGFPSDSIYYDPNSSRDRADKDLPLNVPGGRADRKLVAFFGRANLNFNDKFYLSASLRREGSSMFAPGYQWGWFPAVSAGVALNKVLNLKQFDNLKLRASYGVTGGLPIQEGLSQLKYSYRGKEKDAVLTSYATPDFKWEEKAEFNVGLDFAALDARFTGSVEYYSRNISDLTYFFQNISPIIYPESAAGLWANGGSLTSSGLDVTLKYEILKSTDGPKWGSGINFATFNTQLNELGRDGTEGFGKFSNVGAPGLNGIPTVLVEQNKPLGQIWTFKYTGVDGEGNPTAASKTDGKNYPIGGADLVDADKEVVGNGLPKFILGWTNNFSYKNLDLNFFLRGVFGHSLMNEYRVFYENAEPGSLGQFNRIKTRLYDPAIKNAQFHSYYVEKADFVRLENVSIGYNFVLPANSAFTSLRVSLTGNNLATFTSYTGVDPEVRYGDIGSVDNGSVGRVTRFGEPNPDNLVPGMDRRTGNGSYFTTRSFTLGLNVGF
jgi:TonB-dependent starch-binding outer membrane protein SusC